MKAVPGFLQGEQANQAVGRRNDHLPVRAGYASDFAQENVKLVERDMLDDLE